MLPNVTPLHSRIHRIPSYETEITKVWVKREDELGFGVSGCKKRKYLSLLPFIITQKFTKIALIGGENSNHLQAFLQLLNEKKISSLLFLKKQHNPSPKGNSFLLKLLANSSNIHYVKPEDWNRVGEVAKETMELLGEKPYFIVPEGGSCMQSIQGLSTLMVDIVQNESENDVFFQHIFIDAGTSLTAAVLGFLNAHLARQTQVHVVHIAGDAQLFEAQWKMCNAFFMKELLIQNVRHHSPSTAKSFGSVNAAIWAEISKLAQEEGLLCDPIYTAKLFYTAKKVIQNEKLEGNILIIHSGGGTGLMGFAGNKE